ncbi:MAG: hypothetical protein ACXU86_23950, partial [Archangium sp.]
MMKEDRTRGLGRYPRSKNSAGSFLLAVLAVVMLGGCATSHPLGGVTGGFGPHSRPASFRYDSGLQPPTASPGSAEEGGGAGGFFEQTADAFQVVQEASGLEEEARHPAGAALYLEQARQLLG